MKQEIPKVKPPPKKNHKAKYKLITEFLRCISRLKISSLYLYVFQDLKYRLSISTNFALKSTEVQPMPYMIVVSLPMLEKN